VCVCNLQHIDLFIYLVFIHSYYLILYMLSYSDYYNSSTYAFYSYFFGFHLFKQIKLTARSVRGQIRASFHNQETLIPNVCKSSGHTCRVESSIFGNFLAAQEQQRMNFKSNINLRSTTKLSKKVRCSRNEFERNNVGVTRSRLGEAIETATGNTFIRRTMTGLKRRREREREQ